MRYLSEPEPTLSIGKAAYESMDQRFLPCEKGRMLEYGAPDASQRYSFHGDLDRIGRCRIMVLVARCWLAHVMCSSPMHRLLQFTPGNAAFILGSSSVGFRTTLDIVRPIPN